MTAKPRMTRHTQRFAMDHIASRFDRSAGSLVEDALRTLESVSLCSWTEVAGGRRQMALGKLLRENGWALLQGGPGPMGETAIGADGDVWDVVAWRAKQLGPDLGPGDIVVGTIACLVNLRTGVTALVSDAHLPASVEGGWRARGKRVREYQLAVQRYRRLVRRWRKRYRPDIVVVWADWNLPANKLWVRVWIKGAWPGLSLAPIPRGKGTHAGGRFIDWCLTKGLVARRLIVIPMDEASDHDKVRLVATAVYYRRAATA